MLIQLANTLVTLNKILDELHKMTEQEIIKAIDYHTDCCSSIKVIKAYRNSSIYK